MTSIQQANEWCQWAVRGGPVSGSPARLRRVPDQRGLTLTQVAEQTGLSKSTLSRLETGQRRPSLELLLPLAQVYGVPIDERWVPPMWPTRGSGSKLDA